MSPWFVYIVRCADGSLYTGIAVDVDERIKKHNAGLGAKYTRSRKPVRLVWSERVESESAARIREIEIKKLTKELKEAMCATLKT